MSERPLADSHGQIEMLLTPSSVRSHRHNYHSQADNLPLELRPAEPDLPGACGTGVAHNPGNGYKVTAGFARPNEQAKVTQAAREHRHRTRRFSS
jgi:hypothetical protein